MSVNQQVVFSVIPCTSDFGQLFSAFENSDFYFWEGSHFCWYGFGLLDFTMRGIRINRLLLYFLFSVLHLYCLILPLYFLTLLYTFLYFLYASLYFFILFCVSLYFLDTSLCAVPLLLNYCASFYCSARQETRYTKKSALLQMSVESGLMKRLNCRFQVPFEHKNTKLPLFLPALIVGRQTGNILGGGILECKAFCALRKKRNIALGLYILPRRQS